MADQSMTNRLDKLLAFVDIMGSFLVIMFSRQCPPHWNLGSLSSLMFREIRAVMLIQLKANFVRRESIWPCELLCGINAGRNGRLEY